MRIALAQMEVVYYDSEANLGKMRKLIGLAKKRKADVIVFPEVSITGPVEGRGEMVDSEGRWRRQLSAFAREGGMDVVGCFAESVKGRWYNTACYMDRSGELRGDYRKINLWHSERPYITPGREVSVFDTRFGKAGLAICWDLTNPALFREMAKRGAKAVYIPSFWLEAGVSTYSCESRNLDSLCFVRALENECAIAYANAAGTTKKGEMLIGHSQLAVPIRGAVRRAAHNREALLVAELPEDVFGRAAKIYKIREDIVSGYPP